MATSPTKANTVVVLDEMDRISPRLERAGLALLVLKAAEKGAFQCNFIKSCLVITQDGVGQPMAASAWLCVSIMMIW